MVMMVVVVGICKRKEEKKNPSKVTSLQQLTLEREVLGTEATVYQDGPTLQCACQ